jgi:hypothetical protein
MSIREKLVGEEKKIAGKLHEEFKKLEEVMEHPEYEKKRHIPKLTSKRKEAFQKIAPFLYALNAANAAMALGVRPEFFPVIVAGMQVPAVISYYDTLKEQKSQHEAYKKHLEYEKRKLEGVV